MLTQSKARDAVSPETPTVINLKDAGTVSRVAQLLRIAAESEGPFTLTSIIQRTKLSPATVHRLLALLMREGLIEKDPVRRTYRVGGELFRLGALVRGEP